MSWHRCQNGRALPLPRLFSDTGALGDETPKMRRTWTGTEAHLEMSWHRRRCHCSLRRISACAVTISTSSLVIGHGLVPPKPTTVSFAHDSGQIASAAVSTPHLAAAVGVVNDQHVVAFQQVLADEHGPAH